MRKWEDSELGSLVISLLPAGPIAFPLLFAIFAVIGPIACLIDFLWRKK